MINSDLFKVNRLNYSERYRDLNVESKGIVSSTKFFPVFIDEDKKEKIFKPLSKTKPLCTPLFAYSEVIWSHIINKYFVDNAPLYKLAICDGISREQVKYHEEGTIVDSFLSSNEQYVNLLEYFKMNPDEQVDINNYINYCMKIYDYESIFKSRVFSNNIALSDQLCIQVLLSILRRDQNFHYENVGFVVEDEKIVSLAPTIDHEFSSMFLYLDYEDVHKEIIKSYDEFLIIPSISILIKNIELIACMNPKVAKDFIKKLETLIVDLKKEEMCIKNYDYFKSFSSYDWKIGEARIKKNNDELAIRLESTIVRSDLDIDKFSKNCTQEFISSAEKLCNVIDHFIFN